MITKSSEDINKDYDEISFICHKTSKPVFLTKNTEIDLVAMDINTFNHKEKMLELRNELLSIEEDRLKGRIGCSVDELETALDEIINQF